MKLIQLDSPYQEGEDVKRLQQRLIDLGYDVGRTEPDGIFGLNTYGAVRLFQRTKGLDHDGIVGPITARELSLPKRCPPKFHSGWYFEPPKGRAAWEDVYGTPTGRSSWEVANLGFCSLADLRDNRNMAAQDIKNARLSAELPLEDYGSETTVSVCGVGRLYYPLLHGEKLDFFATRINPNTGERGYGFVCHKLLAPIFHELFKRLVECDMMKHLQTFNGSYVYRATRSGLSLSPHSYGMAIDLDAECNRMGYEPSIHDDVVKVAEQMGFTWGGRFSRPDGMHFQWGSY